MLVSTKGLEDVGRPKVKKQCKESSFELARTTYVRKDRPFNP